MNESIQTSANEPQYRRVRPIVDVYESDGEYRVHIEVPGVKNDDVQLTLEKDSVRFQATRKAFVAEPVVYDRTFALPDVVDRDHVEARLAHGVLTLTLPKRASHQPRQIEIKVA